MLFSSYDQRLNVETMENSSFARLPRELRDEIYTCALQTGRIKVGARGSDILYTTDTTDKHFLAITTTCKQMHDEATPIFLQTNSFRLELNILNDYSHRRCGWPDKCSKYRDWIDYTLKKYSTPAHAIDIDLWLGEIRMEQFDEATSQTVKNEVVCLVKSAGKALVTWTVSLSFDHSSILTQDRPWPRRYQLEGLPFSTGFTEMPLVAPHACVQDMMSTWIGVLQSKRGMMGPGYYGLYHACLECAGIVAAGVLNDITKALEQDTPSS